MSDAEEKIERLGGRWGYVVITHDQRSDAMPAWMVANHTDEGLGPGSENHMARGESLTDALNNALAEDYFTW